MSPINLCTATKTNHEILIETISIRFSLDESPLFLIQIFCSKILSRFCIYPNVFDKNLIKRNKFTLNVISFYRIDHNVINLTVSSLLVHTISQSHETAEIRINKIMIHYNRIHSDLITVVKVRS